MIRALATIAIAGPILAAIPAAVALGQPADDQPPGMTASLTLICWGEGRKPGTSVSTGYAWNSDRHRFEPRTYVHSSSQSFDSEVQLEFQGNRGRIHLTGKLVPPIHSGGVDGWWELQDVVMGEDRISARYRMNGLNKPRVDIDRRSGRIRIDGVEHFRGECDQGDWRGRRF